MMTLAASIAGRELFNGGAVTGLLASLGVNVLTMVIVVGWLYYPDRRDRDHAFMMATLNVIIFLVAHFMGRVELGVGFAFGLFAVFGIIRYRTEALPVREMSYLFAIIAVGMINSVGENVLSWTDLLIANGAIIAMLFILSRLVWNQTPQVRTVTYERIENIRPDRQAELYWDLWERTGLEVVDVEVVSINFMNDTAKLRVHHRAPADSEHSVRSPLAGTSVAASAE